MHERFSKRIIDDPTARPQTAADRLTLCQQVRESRTPRVAPYLLRV